MARLKRAPKKGGSANPGIAAFIAQLHSVQQDELPALLKPVYTHGWQWPRTDLQHWVNPLNRFDDILAQVIADYDLHDTKHCQTNDFTPRTKELVLAVLAFQKVLLENSTNRKIFQGFDRLNDLLHTTDLDVLLATLRLALRPAQQYSSLNSSISSIPFIEKRLLSLAQPWGTREHGLDMAHIAQEGPLEVPLELQEPEWQFYRKVEGGAAAPASGEEDQEKKEKDKGKDVEMEVEQQQASASTSAAAAAPPTVPAGASTPGPARRTTSFAPHLQTPATPSAPSASTSSKPQEGLTSIHLPNLRTTSSSTIDILLDLVSTYQVPESDRLDLLQKIRISKALCGTPAERQQLLIVRLLALSVFAHAQPEQVAQSKVFLYEPELVPQLAELVHPERRDIPIEVKAAALYALEAFARYKGKTLEVASALNASVSHGVLMELVRMTVADLDSDSPTSTPEFIDALFNLLTYINMHQTIGVMVIGAGLINVLLDFVKNRKREHLTPAYKAITLLDGFLYGYSSAFTAYIAAGGLAVFVDRIKYEVDQAVESHQGKPVPEHAPGRENPTGLLTFGEGQILKNIFRATQRLMTTSGTTEGLRNLIDTSLLLSVKTVMSHRQIFGPQIFSLVTNIAATFVHNEPTSLTTLQEAAVPAAFYDSLEAGIPASNDVLQAIPNAIGAFCLNTAGLDDFTSRDLIQRYFSIFTSPAHAEFLRDRDSALVIGSAIDELVRHHPTIRERVMNAIMAVFEEIKSQGEKFVVPEGEKGYGLVPASTSSAPGTKVGGEGMAVDSAAAPASDAAAPAAAAEDVAMAEQAAKEKEREKAKEEEMGPENDVSISMDVFGRFLEGLFQNLGHVQDFIAQPRAFEVCLDLLELPYCPAVMQKNGGYSSIVAIFRIASEVKAAEAITAILKRTDKWLAATTWFWDRSGEDEIKHESTLSKMLNPSADEFDAQQTRFRNLTVLLSLLSLLSDVFINLTYAHGKAATAIISTFVQPEQAEILERVGRVYRACTWENVTVRPTSFWTGDATKSATEQIAKEVPEAEAPTEAAQAAVKQKQEAAAEKAAVEVISTPATPASPNIKLVQDVLQTFTKASLPLFQSIIKLLVHRRSNDVAHRKVAKEVADKLARFLRDSLAWPDAKDLSANLAYSAQSLILVGKLLFDDRPNHIGLQTHLLRSFIACGGLDVYLELVGKLQTVATEYFEANEDASAASPIIIPVFGGIKTALELLSRITSQKTLLEAPQTALLVTREKDPASTDYFDPHAFLVRLRGAVLPVARSLWEQPWLRKAPQAVVRSLVATLINILKGEGEISVEPPPRAETGLGRALGDLLGGGPAGGADVAIGGPLGAALNGLGALLGGVGGGALGGPGAAAARAPAVPDETRVQQLIDMGFPRGAAETALRRCRNNVELAAGYLLEHPDIVGAAREEELRAPAAPAAGDAPADGAAPAQEGEQAAPAADAAAAPAQPAEGEAAAAAPAPEAGPSGEGQADVEMGEATASTSGAEAEQKKDEPAPASAVEEPKGPSLDEIKEQLKSAREQLKPAFMSRALTLAEDYGDLVFDIKNIYSLLNSADEKATPSLQPLLDELNSLVTDDETAKKNEAAAATRLRLLALLTTDAAYRESVEPIRETVMTATMRFQELYTAQKPGQDGRPKWLASAMLVADSLFSIQNVPKPVEILPEGEEVPSVELVAQGPAWEKERQAFFDLALDVLEKGISTREVFISMLRLLLVLTRDHALAQALVDRDGLRMLFSSFATERPETKGCHSYVVMIMRHVVEDKTLLKPMIEREIETWFANSRSKVADITGFIRGASSVAFRDMPTFLEAAKSTIKLVHADAPHHYHVTLLKEPSVTSKTTEHEQIKSPLGQQDSNDAADTTMGDVAAGGKAAPKTVTPAPPATEALVHFLMQQVLDTAKAALAPAPSSTEPAASVDEPAASTSSGESSDAAAASSADADKEKKDGKDAGPPADTPLGDFYQTSFALACLAELVASYNSCKASLLTFSTRKGAGKELGAVGPRSRSSFLYFLLNDLVPAAGLTPSSDFDSKRRTSMWGWASLVIVGLCYDATAASLGTAADKDSVQDVATVRKAVLDAVARAYRDGMTSSEPTETRYSRLSALSDLCHRLLTARPFPHVGKPHSETAMQLAKLMLEKNFAVILTNALAEVDLNFPHVNTLINAILRPLENLTKVVTKLGRAKGSTGPARKGFDDDDFSTDDTSMDEAAAELDALDSDNEEEQDPAADLYRNSALGMYEGELETGHGEEYMSEDEEGFDDDDDRMDEMDEFDGSDISDASDDEDHDLHGGEERDFDDEEMEEIDPDDDDLETASEGDGLDEDDIDEEVVFEDASDDEGAELEVFDEADLDGGEDEWEDEEEDDLDGGAPRAGDELVFDGDAPIQAMDDEDDIDDGGSDGFTDEEEVLTGELEFDPEMTEQLRAQSTAQAYGWDPVTGGDGSSGRRNRALNEEMMHLSDAGMFDRPRNTNTAAAHPLLVEGPSGESRVDSAARRPRGHNATSRDSPAYQEWVRSVEQMLGPGGVNTLQEVLGSHGLAHLTGPEQLRIQLAPGPDGGMAVVIDPSPGLRAAQAQAVQEPSAHRHRSASTSRSAARQLSDRINAASAFLPVQTNQRWQEEGRILQGCVLIAERVGRLHNHLINVLHAPAREEAKKQKVEHDERMKKEEEEERLEEEKAKKEEEEREKEREKERKREEEELRVREEEAAQRRREEEEAENRRREEEEAQQASAAAMDVDSAGGEEVPDDVAEVMNLARSLAAGLAVPSTTASTPSRQATPSTSAAQPAPDASSSAESSAADQPAAMEAEASGSGQGAATERVTVLVYGEEVDITDTGIDREFLEALPDDMRDDVIRQHMRENRRANEPAPPVPEHMDADFLNALPPELRAEVVRSELADRRRTEAAAAVAAAPSGSASGARTDEAGTPAELDPAAFLGTLDPALRSAVLLDRENNGAVPAGTRARRTGMPVGVDVANRIAQARVRLEREAGGSSGAAAAAAAAAAPDAAAAKKAAPHREVIQLLDKSGLATLVRLLFFPQPLRKNALQKVLVNLCENNRTRVELINLLLTILHDGTRDVSAVDKSFSQMSIRASKALGAKDTPRRKVPETPGGGLPHFPGESVPNLIAQRCLEALAFLVSANEQTSLFFLTEQELSITKRSSKKGKGKEKAAAPTTTYPITVLLGLFEREALLKTPQLMENLTNLLAGITRTLSVLQKKPKTADKPESASTAAATSSAETAPASTAAGAEPAAPAGPAASTSDSKDKGKEAKEAPTGPDALVDSPPRIPPSSLRLVVTVLDAGECSSRTFSQTLGLLQNLAHLEGAREVILDELKARAEKISEQLVPDLVNLLEAINSEEPVRGTTLAKFTPASSNQAKLLRILKTIDFFGSAVKKSSLGPNAGEPASKALKPEEEQVKAIYNSLSFSDLWKKLGEALDGIEAKPDLLYLSTVLLPLIESLLVVNKFTDASSTEFIDFTTAHSKILNTMVRNNPSLMSGSFAVLVRNSSMLDFENKRSFFFSRLHDRQQRQRITINLNVRRDHVFEDSYHTIRSRTGEEVKHGKLNIRFYGEEGVDAGGVTREWFGVLARQMFNPNYALFQPQAADSLVYQPNKSSSINEDHLLYFRFIGRIIGKAIHDQRILEAYFSRAVYKHMLGKPVDHRDLESIDPEYYKSLVWMLDNDITDVIDLTFSVERDEFGFVDVVDLIPNGRNIAVTNENKGEYVRLIAEQRLHREIKDQMKALLEGLYEIVPKDILQIFSERELELLISGLPEVDVDEWRGHTDLVGYKPSDPVIGYFWRAVRSFSHEERAKLLQFVTGSSRVPLEGFGALQGMSGVTRFSIHKAGGKGSLPTAHTCFNQLDLPDYESYESFCRQLRTAITEGATGFAFQ
ncbi:hypothetical protein JCM8097_006506 [Rhodosporidiobolus ruineniae]